MLFNKDVIIIVIIIIIIIIIILRSRIFSGIQTFAHSPQTYEGRRCLHNFVV